MVRVVGLIILLLSDFFVFCH
uniref:Uncharacterized protein n=1 Tax=Anguilla anguilla TaxID=7936 RepID=A0A0E9PY34_ANGAN